MHTACLTKHVLSFTISLPLAGFPTAEPDASSVIKLALSRMAPQQPVTMVQLPTQLASARAQQQDSSAQTYIPQAEPPRQAPVLVQLPTSPSRMAGGVGMATQPYPAPQAQPLFWRPTPLQAQSPSRVPPAFGEAHSMYLAMPPFVISQGALRSAAASPTRPGTFTAPQLPLPQSRPATAVPLDAYGVPEAPGISRPAIIPEAVPGPQASGNDRPRLSPAELQRELQQSLQKWVCRG